MADRSSGIFELDALLPAQFYAAFRGGSAARGERRLMLAVLRDALECYQKHAFARDTAGRQLFADAAAWIACEDRRWYFSFENICAVLEIDCAYLRRGLRHWYERSAPCLQPVATLPKLALIEGMSRHAALPPSTPAVGASAIS